MRWNYVFNVVGYLLVFLSISLLLPLTFSLYYKDSAIYPILFSILISFSFAIFFLLLFKNPKTDYVHNKEGIAIVAIAWLSLGFFGALPFYFSEHFISFTDAFFESASGFTTTGSSILSDIEKLPKGLLLWRSFIQWLGGMGIIVLSVAILPFVGAGGMQLYKAEVPSPTPDKLKPRVQDTAIVLWKIYILISVAQVVFLLFGKMSFFDSLCHAFTTMPTGGFSTKNQSIASFNSGYIDTVIIFFMIIAGINFSLHYQLLRGKSFDYWKNSETRFFIILIAILTLIISFVIYPQHNNVMESLRHSAFQVVSIITTTGYATFDYEIWPYCVQIILLLCMFIGATAGSTGGGMKCVRIILCFKYCLRELEILVHPKRIKEIKLDEQIVPVYVIRSIMGFISLYLGIFFICSISLSFMNIDILTSFSAVASALGNIGPGLGSVGPAENYFHLPLLAKWILILCMLLGRLEIYTILIFLVPEFWKK